MSAREIIEAYQALVKKAGRIVGEETDAETALIVSGETAELGSLDYQWGDEPAEFEWTKFPARLLDATEEDVNAWIKARDEEAAARARAYRAQWQAQVTAREREEYERLKAKFGKPEGEAK